MKNNDFDIDNDVNTDYAGNMKEFEEQEENTLDNGDYGDVVYDENSSSSMLDNIKNFIMNNLKIVIIVGAVLILLIILLCLRGCSSKSSDLKSISIDAPDIIYINEETSFETKASGNGSLSDVKYDFKLSNDAVATLKHESLSGKKVTNYITSSNSGEIVLSVNAVLGNSKKEESKNILACKKLNDSSVILKKLTLKLGQKFYLKDNLSLGVSGCSRDLSYTSSDNNVLSIDKNGLGSALKSGSSSVTITRGDLKTTYLVEVVDKTTKVTGISLSKSQVNLKVKEKVQVTASVKPDNASIKDVTWKSSDESVATVENGLVTGLKEGVATIYASTLDGDYKADLKVVVSGSSNTGGSGNSSSGNDKGSLKVSMGKSTTSYTNSYIYITGTITDNAKGLSGYQITKDSKTPSSWISISNNSKTFSVPANDKSKVTENGTYYLWGKSTSGDVVKTSLTINNIDKTGPVIKLGKSSSSYTNDALYITGTITDNTSGISSYAISTSDSTPTSWINISSGSKSYTLPQNDSFKVSKNGTYYVFSKDQAGNVSKSSIKIDNIVTTKPTCSISVTTSGVTLSKTNADSYGLSTSSTATYNGTTSLSLSNNTFYGYVKDKAGNTATCSKKVFATSKNTTTSCPSGYNKCASGYNCQCYSYTKATNIDYYTKTTRKCTASTKTVTNSVNARHTCTDYKTKDSCPTSYGCKWSYENAKCTGSNVWYNCPSGYTRNGSFCTKSTTSTSYSFKIQSVTKTASCTETKIDCIQRNANKTAVECSYVSSEYSCSSGTLSGEYCYFYKNYNYSTSYYCSTGTKLNDSYCYQ